MISEHGRLISFSIKRYLETRPGSRDIARIAIYPRTNNQVFIANHRYCLLCYFKVLLGISKDTTRHPIDLVNHFNHLQSAKTIRHHVTLRAANKVMPML